MKYLGSLVLGLSLLTAAAPVSAKKAEAAPSGPNDVLVELHKGGDKVDFRIVSKQPLKKLSLKWVQGPRRLRLTIPGAHLASPSGRVAIDKGILQWAEAQSNGDSVTVDLATISNPKSKISAGGDQKSLSWSASCIDISVGDQVPSLPGLIAAEAPAASESHPKKPVAAKPPKKPAAEKPVAAKPAEKPAPVEKPPVAPTPPVAQPPAKPPVAQTPATPPKQVASVPKENPPPVRENPARTPVDHSAKPGDTLVSINANGDLRTSLTALAKTAGLTADLDPGVQGTVAATTFTNQPLNKVVSSILARQENLYTYTIVGKTLKVSSSDGAGGKSVTPVAQAASGGRVSSEYFPIKDKKAVDVLDAVRKAVPGLTYTLDERLNQIIAEGEPSDLERLRKLLVKVSAK